MKVHKPSEIPAQPVNAPLFTGGPVTRQTLLTPEASNDFNLGIVNFSPGARNKMHTHSSDQVLFVTAGKGIIATETEQQIIVPGRSEEHTSELQSRPHLVCRLLLEKKKKQLTTVQQ